MKIRAFATLLTAAFALAALSVPAGAAGAVDSVGLVQVSLTQVSLTQVGDDQVGDTTRPTINEFFPEKRPLSDCFSALPKPNCGSEARGGWPQTTVFLSIIAGLAFIAWRIVAGARRARREAAAVTPGTPASTTVPDDDGGAPTP